MMTRDELTKWVKHRCRELMYNEDKLLSRFRAGEVTWEEIESAIAAIRARKQAYRHMYLACTNPPPVDEGNDGNLR